MTEHALTIAIAGATGALGEQLLIALEASDLAPGRLVPIASPASVRPHVEFHGKPVKVVNPDADALESVDVVFAALPAGPADDLLRDAAEAGCLVIDLAGIFASNPTVPLVAMGANSVEMDAIREAGAVRVPGPVALALVEVGAAAAQLGTVASLRGVAMLPASVAGRKGVDELSAQVTAVFNGRTPPRAVFANGLAFDILPSWGPAGRDGWTQGERRVAADVGRALALDPRRIAVSELVTPLFAGMALELNVLFGAPVSAEQLRVALEERSAIALTEGRRLSPRARLGTAGLAIGRLRDDPGGLGVHLFVSADPTRLSAQHAVALLQHLIEESLF